MNADIFSTSPTVCCLGLLLCIVMNYNAFGCLLDDQSRTFSNGSLHIEFRLNSPECKKASEIMREFDSVSSAQTCAIHCYFRRDCILFTYNEASGRRVK